VATSRLNKQFTAWHEQKLKPFLDKSPERKDVFSTESHVDTKTVYTELDTDDKNQSDFPGDYPYTRGIYPSMYRGRLWTMRQYAGFGTAEETNKRNKYLLESGQTGLSIAFDLPTQLGYDSNHPMAAGEVGRTGVIIDSLRDMEILFDGIPLEEVSTSMTINAPAIVLLAMYVAIAEKQGASLENLRGTIQNDILKEYMARNTYIFPPGPSLQLTMDIFETCSKHLPCWNMISVSGYHIREAGANAVQELAFTFADAIEYIKAALSRGLNIDAFAGGLSFFFSAGSDMFEEIAKFRAARRIYARLMKDRFQAQLEKSLTLKFHTQTAGSTLTAKEPLNNIVRVAYQALAAVLGGTQSLHTNSYDEALALPTTESVRIALRTQQILAYETGITNTVDPLGGSYFIEKLTDELETKVWEEIKRIDELGGMRQAIEDGYPQRQIMEESYKTFLTAKTGGKTIVGVNRFLTKEDSEKEVELHFHSPELESLQIERLEELKRTRDTKCVIISLQKLKDRIRRGGELFPYVYECVKCYCTIGEICAVMREEFGEYQQRIAL